MRLAAHNNAMWCDAVCRAHGLPGRFLDDAWVNPQRTPPFYPDAVTLAPQADVLGMIDRSAGAGIKDSFAALDLSAEGFSVLFAAQWIYHPPSTLTTKRQWHVVTDSAFPAALWEDPSVRMLACGDATAVINHSGDAVGVSNVDGPAWDWIVAAITEIWPGLPIVGYEQDVAEPLRHGFEAAGPLRIWVS